ncbi:MAG: hypothetical protein IJS67_03025 [Clostridia bacterium]|nr:hypothetical protein [Clostridia bacterium]
MRIKNSVNIAVNNYGLVFKNLLYKLVVFLIFSLIVSLILRVRLHALTEKLTPIADAAKNIFFSVVNGRAVNPDALNAAFSDFYGFLSENVGNFVLTGVFIFFALFVYKFLSGMSDCTLTVLVYNYMTTMSRLGYLRVMTENLGRIALFQLVRGIVEVLYDAVALIVLYGVFAASITLNPFISLFTVILLTVLFKALFETFAGQITAKYFNDDNMTVAKSFDAGFASVKGYFPKMFASYLSVTIVYIYLFISFTLFTMGVGTIFFVPFASLVFVCIREVDYFTVSKKKYFVDYDNIIVPKELRENDEGLLSDVDI